MTRLAVKQQAMKPTDGLTLQHEAGKGIALTGALILATVTETWKQSLVYFQDRDTLPKTIDFSGVTRVDSAGLALMIEWLRLAKNKNTEIHLQNIPAQMQPLAVLFDISHLLH